MATEGPDEPWDLHADLLAPVDHEALARRARESEARTKRHEAELWEWQKDNPVFIPLDRNAEMR